MQSEHYADNLEECQIRRPVIIGTWCGVQALEFGHIQSIQIQVHVVAMAQYRCIKLTSIDST